MQHAIGAVDDEQLAGWAESDTVEDGVGSSETLPSARIANPECVYAPAAVIDNRTPATGNAHCGGPDVNTLDHRPFAAIPDTETAVSADADPVPLWGIPR